jgi:formamidopyrimidine-DNA glycosylase
VPELPEVECLTRAVRAVLEGGVLRSAEFLRAAIRDPIPIDAFNEFVVGQRIEEVYRRSKYLLMRTKKGVGVFHLGMTGALLLKDEKLATEAHTHAIFRFTGPSGKRGYLHYVDPRRFGRIACVEGQDLNGHALFSDLGVEPLVTEDLGGYLFERSRGKSLPVKSFIMDARVVVGVGNIYASESLFGAGISPKREAGTVSRARYGRLGEQIKETLEKAIKAGGTTFRDFKNSDGNPGYFAVELKVYDRAGENCESCGNIIKTIRQSGRSTFFCAFCQT